MKGLITMNKKKGALILTLSLALSLIAVNSVFASTAFTKNTDNIVGTAIEAENSGITTANGEITQDVATKKGIEAIKNKYGIDVSDMDQAILLDKENGTWNMSFAPNPDQDKNDDIEIKKVTMGPDDITNIPEDQWDNVYEVYSKSEKGFDTYTVQINAETGEVVKAEIVVMGTILDENIVQ